MKKTIIRVLFLLSAALFLNVTICKADPGDTLNIPIIIPDIEPNNQPHLIPIHAAVYGVCDRETPSLILHVSYDIIPAHVRFYRNGTLIVSDEFPILLGNTINFNLSLFGSGAYTVMLCADDGTVYIGSFAL